MPDSNRRVGACSLSDYESGVNSSNLYALAPVGFEPTPRDYEIVGQLIKACVFQFHHGAIVLVVSSGLEPPTSRLSGERSNQLSYETIKH